MSIWWSLHLRREAASVPLARRFLLGAMETAGVDPDISFDLSVALSEACANAVEHGGDHRGLGEQGVGRDPWGVWDEATGTACGQYRVTAYLDGEKCRIEVADSGPGFPARRTLRTSAQQHDAQLYPSLSAENGRGLCLIEQLADHVHFGNRPGRGAVVSFDKVLKWRKGALLMVS
ncbi:ATP-binding protein [Streptomyces sp. Ncost-T10-10d]|uniref:ATP-binding protein n=1 Tax=Streptomyces sp. Ncost-T10-10d TaxID=1839774 RepID=UPI00081EA15D|nr:ATP-binding protein [Streptomyces sp. Ncost-T10-10d]SCF64188.1 serine/threonine-protein kinase RsbW [Streptomyces sp. Ncost-T10-10d]